MTVEPRDVYRNPTNLTGTPFLVRGTRVSDGVSVAEFSLDYPETTLSFQVGMTSKSSPHMIQPCHRQVPDSINFERKLLCYAFWLAQPQRRPEPGICICIVAIMISVDLMAF